MKVWLPSNTLTTITRWAFFKSAAVGVLSFTLITSLTSDCHGQFSSNDQVDVGLGRSVLDVAEPHQSGSQPKPYKANARLTETTQGAHDSNGLQAIGTHVVARDGLSEEAVPPHHQQDRQVKQVESPSANGLRRASMPPQRFTNFAASEVPAFSAGPSETITPPQQQHRAASVEQVRVSEDVIVDRSVSPASYAAPVQSFQNQPRQNQPGQTKLGSLRNRSDRRQADSHRQENIKPKKVSTSAKVLIAKFGFNESQEDAGDAVPLRLADVLNQGQGRASRSQLIEQYWETFYDWAQSVSAQKHRDWVTGVRVSKSTDQATFGVAKSSAENEVSFTRIQLGKSQAKLKLMVGSTSAIVPVDLPTVTLVKTNFQAFKERGLIPARYEGIDQALTDLHDLVVSRADTVLMAERNAQQIAENYQSNRATLEQLLSAGRAWRVAEADFISSAIEYNKSYADYALALPYGRAPVEQVVAMLVVSTKGTLGTRADTSRSRLSRSPSQPASSSRSRDRTTPPQRRPVTPQSGRDSRVRAASNGFGQSRAPQSSTQRPMPDFSNPSNPSTAASFTSPKPTAFRPRAATNSAVSLAGSPAPQQATRPSAASFSQESSASQASVNSSNQAKPTAGGVAAEGTGFGATAFGGTSKPMTQPATRPATRAGTADFGSNTASRGFGGVSASRRSANPVKTAGSGSTRDAFSNPTTQRPPISQPAARPPAQPVAKPTTSFGDSGFGSTKKPARSQGDAGFSSGFGG